MAHDTPQTGADPGQASSDGMPASYTQGSGASEPAPNATTGTNDTPARQDGQGSPSSDASDAPSPPTTRRLNFGERLMKNIGNGVISGMLAGAVRVGFMAFCVGVAFALLGTLAAASVPGAFMAGVMSQAVPLGLMGAVGGGLFVGGFNFFKGLYTSIKDQIFDPNQGAETVQSPAKGRGKGHGEGKNTPSAGSPDASSQPYLTEDAIVSEPQPQTNTAPRPKRPEQASPEASAEASQAPKAEYVPETVIEPDMAGNAKQPPVEAGKSENASPVAPAPAAGGAETAGRAETVGRAEAPEAGKPAQHTIIIQPGGSTTVMNFDTPEDAADVTHSVVTGAMPPETPTMPNGLPGEVRVQGDHLRNLKTRPPVADANGWRNYVTQPETASPSAGTRRPG